jgi:LysM repeat protein
LQVFHFHPIGGIIVRTTLLRPAWLLMAALLLVACTRDRPTPEPTPTPAAVTPASTTPSPSEPKVEAAGKTTPTPEATVAGEVTPTPEATSTQKTFDYTVKGGDTLADIATKFETTVQVLSALNFLLDDNIFAGQVLAVPFKEGMTAEGAPTPTPTPFTYVVQAGDSLFSLTSSQSRWSK